jgi:hypothetical protein
LPADQKCLLLLDVWTVHLLPAFRGHIEEKYPWIFVLYIPAGCTVKKQPSDVGLQKPLKDAARKCFSGYVTSVITAAIDKGIPPFEVQLNLRLTYLRPVLVKVIEAIYEHLHRRGPGEVCIEQIWHQARGQGYKDLGYAAHDG